MGGRWVEVLLNGPQARTLLSLSLLSEPLRSALGTPITHKVTKSW